MDPLLAMWVKELALRQNIPPKLTDAFLAMLPGDPADSDSESFWRVRRAILQRRLAEAVGRRVITPCTLGTVQGLYATRPLPAAADAYRVLVLHFVAYSADFPRALYDLRSHHIPALLRYRPTAGLASPRLESEVRDLERAATDRDLRVEMMNRYSKGQALQALMVLLEAEYEDAGPPILDFVAENMKGEGAENVPGGSRPEGTAPEVARPVPARQQATQTPPGAAQQQAPQTLPEAARQQATMKAPLPVTEQQAPQTPPGAAKQQAPRTPPVAAQQQAPQTLPEAARQQAKTAPPAVTEQQATKTLPAVTEQQAPKTRSGSKAAEMPPRGGEIHTPSGEKQMTGQSKIDGSRLGKGTTTLNAGGGNSSEAMERDPAACKSRLGKGATSTSNEVMEPAWAAHKSRLGKDTTPTTDEEENSKKKAMELDPAARNSQRGKDPMTTNEKEENSKKAMQQDPVVPAYEPEGGVKRKAVRPPAMVETKRRKIRRWSVLEEDTLRSAVQELGKGCWKKILQSHSDIFVGRTEVDLKDKWRNMTR